MTTTLQQGVQKIEAALKGLETDVEAFLKDTVEPALESEWAALKPQILGLGQTVLGSIWTAAEAYLTSGGPLTPGDTASFVGSIVSELPADLQALEHLVLAAFAGAVQSIQSKTAATPAPAPAP